MSPSVDLPIGRPGYEYDVFGIGQFLKAKSLWGRTKEGKFYVCNEYVFINTKPHTALVGIGTTFDDACCDYMRQARGAELVHIINNLVGTFV